MGRFDARSRRSIVAALLVLTVMLVTASASAQSEEVVEQVRAHDESATIHFQAGRYTEALAAMAEAQAALPDVRRLFNMARCHEELGHGTEAIELYLRYAESDDISAERGDIARLRIERLRTLESESLASDAPPQEPPVTGRPRIGPAAFWGLLGVTAASTLTWVVLAAAAASIDARHAEAAELDQRARFDRLGLTGRQVTVAADVVMGVGLASAVALLVVGLFTDFGGDGSGESGRARAVSLGVGPTSGGASFALRW